MFFLSSVFMVNLILSVEFKIIIQDHNLFCKVGMMCICQVISHEQIFLVIMLILKVLNIS